MSAARTTEPSALDRADTPQNSISPPQNTKKEDEIESSVSSLAAATREGATLARENGNSPSASSPTVSSSLSSSSCNSTSSDDDDDDDDSSSTSSSSGTSSAKSESEFEGKNIVSGRGRSSKPALKASPKRRARRSSGASSLSRTAGTPPRKRQAVSNDRHHTSPAASTSRRKDASKRTEASDSDSDSSDEDECGKRIVTSRKAQRDARTTLIARVLSRWWYVLPEWPPPDIDYKEELRKRRFKVVELGDWENADDVDDAGFTKVYQLSHFEGIYRDPNGQAVDVRPIEGKPCYSTLSSKSELELYELLVTALQNQINDVDKSPYQVTEQSSIAKLKKDLQQELQDVDEALTKLQRRKLFLESRKQRNGNIAETSDSPVAKIT